MSVSAWLRKLDRRLIVLPLIGLGTTAAVLVPAELVLQHRYPDQPEDRCLNLQAMPLHGRANCTSYVKAGEGPWVRNSYNDCGYRSPLSCGPLPPDRRRIAVIGSSMGAGTFVPEPQSVVGRLTATMQVACGEAVQSQNLAVPALPVGAIVVSAKEALRLKPSALVITVTSYDLQDSSGGKAQATKSWFKRLTETAQVWLKSFAVYRTAKSLYLSSEPDYLNFIRAQARTDDQVERSVHDGVQALSTEITEILNATHMPPASIVLVFIPDRETVARRNLRPDQQDAVSKALGSVAAKHGLSFIDTLQAMPRSRPTASLYYVANGHLNAIGDGYVAHGMATGLFRDVPAFRSCALKNARTGKGS